MTILSFIVFHKAIENTIVENKIYILHGTPPSTYIKNDLQLIMNGINKRLGLNINARKTKYEIINKNKHDTRMMIDGNIIKRIHQLIYLVYLTSSETEIKIKCSYARKILGGKKLADGQHT